MTSCARALAVTIVRPQVCVKPQIRGAVFVLFCFPRRTNEKLQNHHRPSDVRSKPSVHYNNITHNPCIHVEDVRRARNGESAMREWREKKNKNTLMTGLPGFGRIGNRNLTVAGGARAT